MSYLTVITLDQAKLHLRIDDDTFDSEITRMIKSALSICEQETKHILYARDKDYFTSSNGCLRVFDYPINSVVDPVDTTGTQRQLWTDYSIAEDSKITLNVGYTNPDEVPTQLIDAALQIMDVWFYGSEKQMNISLIPDAVYSNLHKLKRFII